MDTDTSNYWNYLKQVTSDEQFQRENWDKTSYES